MTVFTIKKQKKEQSGSALTLLTITEKTSDSSPKWDAS
jgi:hypothetical protein